MSKKNRSKKQNSKSNVHMEQSSLGNRTTSPMPTTLQDRMALIDNKLDDIAGEMDRDYMAYGKTCAKLFRALVDAAVVLPDMELYTSLLTVDNNSDTMTVSLKRGKLEKMCHPEQDAEQDEYTEQDEDDTERDNARSGDRFCDDCMGCKGCSGCPGPDDDDDDWEDDEEENLREY
jgi:hypothetical protein